jgi:hypothetical protein
MDRGISLSASGRSEELGAGRARISRTSPSSLRTTDSPLDLFHYEIASRQVDAGTRHARRLKGSAAGWRTRLQSTSGKTSPFVHSIARCSFVGDGVAGIIEALALTNNRRGYATTARTTARNRWPQVEGRTAHGEIGWQRSRPRSQTRMEPPGPETFCEHTLPGRWSTAWQRKEFTGAIPAALSGITSYRTIIRPAAADMSTIRSMSWTA